jgi:hypothetical protein
VFSRQAMSWADELKDREVQIEVARYLGIVLYCAGDFVESKRIVERGLALIESSGAVLYLNWMLMAHASLIVELDAVPEAHRCLERLEAADRETELRMYLAGVGNRVILEFYLGNFAQALAKADEFINANTIDSWMDIPVRGLRGQCELELGRVAQAYAVKPRNWSMYWKLPNNRTCPVITYVHVACD